MNFFVRQYLPDDKMDAFMTLNFVAQIDGIDHKGLFTSSERDSESENVTV